jgi:hypothetical protein
VESPSFPKNADLWLLAPCQPMALFPGLFGGRKPGAAIHLMSREEQSAGRRHRAAAAVRHDGGACLFGQHDGVRMAVGWVMAAKTAHVLAGRNRSLAWRGGKSRAEWAEEEGPVGASGPSKNERAEWRRRGLAAPQLHGERSDGVA